MNLEPRTKIALGCFLGLALGLWLARIPTPALAQERGLTSALSQAEALNGTPTWLGEIVVSDAGFPVDNSTTAVPFTIPKGANILVVGGSVASKCINLGATATNAVASKMVPIAAGEKFGIGLLHSDVSKVSCDTTTTAVSNEVFEVN